VRFTTTQQDDGLWLSVCEDQPEARAHGTTAQQAYEGARWCVEVLEAEDGAVNGVCAECGKAIGRFSTICASCPDATANPRTAGCTLRPFTAEPGRCDACGKALTGRRRTWCSTDCQTEWEANHDWAHARLAALRRTSWACERCGVVDHLNIEVNHREPLVGHGYNRSCAHHQDNLEPLCVPCHRAETARQVADRRAS
jgi:hypothetical protein